MIHTDMNVERVEAWRKTLEYAVGVLEASGDRGDNYCADQIKEQLALIGTLEERTCPTHQRAFPTREGLLLHVRHSHCPRCGDPVEHYSEHLIMGPRWACPVIPLPQTTPDRAARIAAFDGGHPLRLNRVPMRLEPDGRFVPDTPPGGEGSPPPS